jgi:hypothetical protein
MKHSEDYVVCAICNVQLTQISASHLKTHGTTIREYRLNFPEAALVSQSVKKNRRKSIKEKYGVENPYDDPAVKQQLVEKAKKTNLKKFGTENPNQLNEIKEKIVQTNLHKYGVAHATKLEKTIEKRIQTNLHKYGVEHYVQTAEYKEKVSDTCLEKYGAKTPLESNEIKQKIKQTNLERYGCESAFQNKEIRDKIKKTLIEKFGVENVLNCPEILEKIKKTNLETYGHESPVGSPIIQHKITNTNLLKFGCEYPLQSDEIRSKSRRTCLDKYGAPHPLASKQIQQKIKERSLDRHGVPYAMNLPVNQEKQRASFVNKHGVDNPMRIPGLKEKKLATLRDKMHERHQEILLERGYEILDKYTGSHKIHKYRHLECGTEFEFQVSQGIESAVPCCRVCHPVDPSRSQGEIELFTYVNHLCPDAVPNSRSLIPPYELDIFVPSKNIAFEFSGLYWHSIDMKPDKNYHYLKWKMCKDLGIQLITIWDSEWLLKNQIVKRRIAHLLGVSDSSKIVARKCEIRQISTNNAKLFCDNTHLHGYTSSSIKLGAYFQDELVGVMTFGKRTISKNSSCSWEIMRFCTKCHIPGLASKLFKHFTRNWQVDDVISYSDNRWDTGRLYQTLGFVQKNIPRPGYAYTKDYLHLEHRFKFTKSTLVKMGYPQHLTEKEIMRDKGYSQVWDCGQIRWEWSRYAHEVPTSNL